MPQDVSKSFATKKSFEYISAVVMKKNNTGLLSSLQYLDLLIPERVTQNRVTQNKGVFLPGG